MIDALRKRLNKDEEGFTLIELMVVVLIIGILVAIAVPTFLNAQDNAKSKAAQSNARSALSAFKTLHAEKETYSTIVLADLTAAEPSLAWTAEDAAISPAKNVEQVSWAVDATSVYLAVQAKNGDCFFIRDTTDTASVDPAPGTFYGKTRGSATTCDANDTPGTHVYSKSQATGWAK